MAAQVRPIDPGDGSRALRPVILVVDDEPGLRESFRLILDDEYEVRVQIDEQHCSISVKNTGNGFDAAALQGVMPDPTSPRGRGVAIMRTLMDRVDFDSGEEAGTIVHLVKTLTIEPGGLLGRLRRGPHAPSTPL